MHTSEKLDKIIDFVEQDITRTKLAGNHEFVQYHALRGGWSEWVSPKMKGYLMKCCDCDLVHEIEFKIVRFVGKPDSDGLTETEPIKEKDIQVLWRLRRKSELPFQTKSEMRAEIEILKTCRDHWKNSYYAIKNEQDAERAGKKAD